MKEIKVVIDTNIFVKMLIGRTTTFRKLYQAFLTARYAPVISLEIKDEILDVISRPRIKKYFTLEELRHFKEMIDIDTIRVIPDKRISMSICRDPEDEMIIDAAISAKVKYIVSSDKDLLEIPPDKLSPIKVIPPEEFLNLLEKE